MKDWRKDKERADIFMPKIKAILGRLFIGESTESQDQEEATDLIVLELNRITIACRMRDLYYYYERDYRNEITIRFSRPSGAKSEYDKIIDGWGDYFFYGFGDFNTGQILAYTVIDLKGLRAAFVRVNLSKETRKNLDNSSSFRVVKLRELPPNCIVKRYQREGVCAV